MVIGFDMRGTTAKCSTIVNHEPSITNEYRIGSPKYPVRFPFVDLVEVSAGGGTIAWVDRGGALRIGPLSAGSDPGPVCYGRGNDKPTITDANLILGKLGEEIGSLKLRKDLAKESISKLADQLGLGLEEAAFGIIKLSNVVMSKALRIVTVERGYDPREFTMFAFGGAGGLHGVELADELEIKSILIPPHAGVFSAIGLLLSDYRVDKVRSLIVLVDDVCEDFVEGEFSKMVEEAVGDVGVFRYVDVRYSITVPWTGKIESCVEIFHEKHEELYGFCSKDEEVEIVNLRVTAFGITSKPEIRREREFEYLPKPEYFRDVYFEDEWVRTPIYSRSKLKAGARIDGPAVC